MARPRCLLLALRDGKLYKSPPIYLFIVYLKPCDVREFTLLCPLFQNYIGVLEALIKIEEELRLPPDVQADVNCSAEWLKSSEFGLATIRIKVLQCIGDNNKVLQSSNVTMEGRAKNVSRLVKEIQTMKDSWLKLFEEAKRSRFKPWY